MSSREVQGHAPLQGSGKNSQTGEIPKIINKVFKMLCKVMLSFRSRDLVNCVGDWEIEPIYRRLVDNGEMSTNYRKC